MRTAVLALSLFISTGFGAAIPQVRHVPNFDKVNDHLYRGGQPSLVGLEELGALGIRRVIDLREKGELEETERRSLGKLGIKYVNLPFSAFAAPTQEQVDQVLGMLNDKESTPTFLHCRRGKDRTGTVIACYRIQHDHWTNQQALQEAREHGMSSLERGMRSFVLHFAAMANGSASVSDALVH